MTRAGDTLGERTFPQRKFWLGGSTGAGKTTVAQILACRLGLRCYHVDAFGWDHVSRSGPAHERFMAMSLDERWVAPDPAEMAEWFVDISRERMAMIAEDLDALPDEPLTIVEGPQLFPELLPERACSVFLASTDRFRVETGLATRPFGMPVSDPEAAQRNRVARDRLLSERIRLSAAASCSRVIEVDGSKTADEIAAEVEELLPSHQPASDVRSVRRWENAAVARQLRLWVESGEGPAVARPFPYACECGETGCCLTLELPLERFDALVAEGGWVGAHA